MIKDVERVLLSESDLDKIVSELAVKIENGFFSASNIYYEWNRFENRLYLKTSTDVEFVFNVGSDICTINGMEEKLDKPFYLFDRLPVLPLKFLLDMAGIKYTDNDGALNINVRPAKDITKTEELK